MILSKLNATLRSNGMVETLKIIMKYPFHLWKIKNFEKLLGTMSNPEDKFTWIYRNNYWGIDESLSGPGSTLEYTENLRLELPKLLKDFNISSILDLPCGDFNWMKILMPTLNVNYIGGDIVQDLVDSNNSNYKNDSIEFIKLNLTKDSLPYSDLMICRDCLFHLSFEDIQKFLMNYVDSKIPYLLTTTHKNNNNFQNTDIQTGDHRSIDLFLHPFNFPKTPLVRIDDFLLPEPEREMCLFSREQILSVIK
jgi:hypothetical protein